MERRGVAGVCSRSVIYFCHVLKILRVNISWFWCVQPCSYFTGITIAEGPALKYKDLLWPYSLNIMYYCSQGTFTFLLLCKMSFCSPSFGIAWVVCPANSCWRVVLSVLHMHMIPWCRGCSQEGLVWVSSETQCWQNHLWWPYFKSSLPLYWKLEYHHSSAHLCFMTPWHHSLDSLVKDILNCPEDFHYLSVRAGVLTDWNGNKIGHCLFTYISRAPFGSLY